MVTMAASDQSPTPSQLSFWQTYKLPILLSLASVIVIVLSLALLVKSLTPSVPIRFSAMDQETASASAAGKRVVVDVAGALMAPGVYTLPAGSRVEDALTAAGGLSAEADSEFIAKNINRAQLLIDGMKFYVPEKGEDMTSHNGGSLFRRPESPENELTVNINSATQVQLESLTGVGPVTAGKIISNRPYTMLEDLVNKKAVSRSLFEKIKAFLTL